MKLIQFLSSDKNEVPDNMTRLDNIILSQFKAKESVDGVYGVFSRGSKNEVLEAIFKLRFFKTQWLMFVNLFSTISDF